MYQKGDVLLKEHRRDEHYGEDHDCTGIYDSDRRNGVIPCAEKYVALGHRCDLWVIGGPEEVKQMANDLIDVYLKMTGKDWAR